MIPENIAVGTILFSQAAMGILGNWSLLVHYFILIFTGKSLMLKDLIVKHLIFANSLVIISRGIPQIMSEFGLKSFLNDFICKLVVYCNRVSRGVSLCTTCLLSCFQAITISPSNSRWMKIKHRAIKYIGPSCSFSWIVHLLLNIMAPMRVTASNNSENVTNRFNFGYCAGFVSGTFTTPLYVFLLCFTDGLCLGLMVWASVTMVSILYRHKGQVQYIHGANYCHRDSPVSRATQSILILVVNFVTCYSVSSLMILYMVFFDNPSLSALNILTFLETCFPTFSPFVLISSKNSASRLYFLHGRKCKILKYFTMF